MSSETAAATPASGIMSCITASGYGEAEDVIGMSHNMPKPVLAKGDKKILVKVLAVSLAPGDCRVMSGRTSMVQGPPSFPYIPGGDSCGVVEEVPEGETRFKKGDHVICMFDTPGPRGALAEYATYNVDWVAPKPANLTPEEAACLPSSVMSGMVAVEMHVKKGHRVMVLGGSGGVGAHVIQMVKDAGASFVATTSTQSKLAASLGADRVVDYRTENWWEIKEFGEQPFDLVIDLVGYREPWERAKSSGVLKNGWNGGHYLTFASDTPYMKLQSMLDIPKLMWDMLARKLWTSIWRWDPKWSWHLDGLEPKQNGNLARVSKKAEEGKFKVVMDPRGPFSFTAEGVKEAFRLQKEKHQTGKVVISLQSKS